MEDAVNGWRTINLLSHWGKALVRIVLRPVKAAIAKTINRCQFGGLPGRGTREAVAMVEEIIERLKNWKPPNGKRGKKKLRILVAILFDLEKAFDKVPRARVWEILQEKILRR